MRTTIFYSRQLTQFIWGLLLPAVPRLAWWVLGLIALSGLNLLFSKELWPHFPRAEKWFCLLLGPCLGALPWLAAYTAGQVRRRVQDWWWQGFWQMVAFGAYVGATMFSVLLLFGLVVGLM